MKCGAIAISIMVEASEYIEFFWLRMPNTLSIETEKIMVLKETKIGPRVLNGITIKCVPPPP